MLHWKPATTHGQRDVIALVWIQTSNDSNNQILMFWLQHMNRTIFLCLFKGKWDFNVIGSSIKPFSNIKASNDNSFQPRQRSKCVHSTLQVIIRRWKYNRSSALWVTIDFLLHILLISPWLSEWLKWWNINKLFMAKAPHWKPLHKTVPNSTRPKFEICSKNLH